jgi:hypothetical protein
LKLALKRSIIVVRKKERGNSLVTSTLSHGLSHPTLTQSCILHFCCVRKILTLFSQGIVTTTSWILFHVLNLIFLQGTHQTVNIFFHIYAKLDSKYTYFCVEDFGFHVGF